MSGPKIVHGAKARVLIDGKPVLSLDSLDFKLEYDPMPTIREMYHVSSLLRPLLQSQGVQVKYLAMMDKLETLPEGKLTEHPPRTRGIIGYTEGVPEVGSRMRVYGESLEGSSGPVRLWTTSPITEVREDTNQNCRPGVRLFQFKTENSRYSILLETQP